MAALDFPSSPINGQVYTANGKTWNYNSTSGSWINVTGVGYVGSVGGLGYTGSVGSPLTPRVYSTTTLTSLAPNSNLYDQHVITALASALSITADTGTPSEGQKMLFRFKDNGIARTLTWTVSGAKSFRAVGIILPTSTVISKVTYVGCVYNATDGFWDVIATLTQA